jgi:hypothetical protein
MLTDFDREQLSQPSSYWIAKLSKSEGNEIIGEILLAMRKWRAKEKRKPTYQSPVVHNGLLGGGLLGLGGMKAPEPDDIEVAFHLWLSGDTSFNAVLRKRGLYAVFAVIFVYERKTAKEWSIYRANEFLVRGLFFELQVAHEAGREMFDALRMQRTKKQQHLIEIREKSAKSRQERAVKREEKIRSRARYILSQNPKIKRTPLAKQLMDERLHKLDDKDKTPLTLSGVVRALAGVG